MGASNLQRPIEPPLNSERGQLGFQMCSCGQSACLGLLVGENELGAPVLGGVRVPLRSFGFGVLICAHLRLKFKIDE